MSDMDSCSERPAGTRSASTDGTADIHLIALLPHRDVLSALHKRVDALKRELAAGNRCADTAPPASSEPCASGHSGHVRVFHFAPLCIPLAVIGGGDSGSRAGCSQTGSFQTGNQRADAAWLAGNFGAGAGGNALTPLVCRVRMSFARELEEAVQAVLPGNGTGTQAMPDSRRDYQELLARLRDAVPVERNIAFGAIEAMGAEETEAVGTNRGNFRLTSTGSVSGGRATGTSVSDEGLSPPLMVVGLASGASNSPAPAHFNRLNEREGGYAHTPSLTNPMGGGKGKEPPTLQCRAFQFAHVVVRLASGAQGGGWTWEVRETVWARSR